MGRQTQGRAITYTETVNMVTEICCNCGIIFAIEESYQSQRRNDGEFFHCPNGHRQHYTDSASKDDQIAKLQEEISRRELLLAREREFSDKMAEDLKARNKELKTIKARVKNGVCPCCNRTFVDLQRHMKTKHPDYAEKEGEK